MPPEEQGLRVRDAVPGDAEAIAAIARRAWPAAYRGLFDEDFIELVVGTVYDAATISSRVETAISEEDAEFLVADEAGRVVAFLHFGAGERGPELHALYVDPDRLRAGIGHAMMRELNGRLRAGTEYVALVREGNTAAIRFYERLGFERAELVDGFARFMRHLGLGAPRRRGAGRDLLMRYRVPG